MSQLLEEGELKAGVIWRNSEALGEVPWQFTLRAIDIEEGWRLEAVCRAAEIVIVLKWPESLPVPSRTHVGDLQALGFEIVKSNKRCDLRHGRPCLSAIVVVEDGLPACPVCEPFVGKAAKRWLPSERDTDV
jgi:hypothetical protein